MCKLNGVKEKVFGLLIPKDNNDDVTTADLRNNEYLVVDYLGYWIMYGVTTKDEMKRVLSVAEITEEPTMQESIRKMISKNYSKATKIFEVNDQLTACFLSNILSQLGIIYSVYGNVVHTSSEDKLEEYLYGKTDIPNLTQIITAYGGTFSFSNTMLARLKEHIDENMFITHALGTVIPKPDRYELLVALSVFVVMTGCKFIEDDSSFYTNDDTSKCMEFTTNNLVIYDKIELQKQ